VKNKTLTIIEEIIPSKKELFWNNPNAIPVFSVYVNLKTHTSIELLTKYFSPSVFVI
jgi:hypothetical protein